MFPLSRFHGRWEKDLSRKDFTSPEEIENKKFLHGQEYITSTFAIDGSPSPSIIAAGREKSGDLVDYDKHLIDIIEFCKEKDITLILTHMPSQKKWSVDKNTTIHSIAEQYDVPFVDYMEESLWNSANMDLTTDYFDASHFNCRGAEKVTRLYGDLLAESGLLSDKRSNPAYAQWNEDIDAYDSVLSDSLLTATSFPSDFFGKLRSEDKLILISVDAEDYTSVMDDDMQAWLTELGLDGNGKGLVPNGAKVYAACIDQNQILCDTVSKSSSIQKKLFSNGRHISLSAQHNSAGYTAFTVDSMENKSYPDKGIHIFVYNTFLEKPIDSVTMYKNSEGKWVFIRTQTWQ